MFFDPMYFLFLAPAFLLAMWAQFRVKSAYAEAQQQPAPLSGAAAARHILDQAGLQSVSIEMVPGEMTDHYDPRKCSGSTDVYQNRSLAAVRCHLLNRVTPFKMPSTTRCFSSATPWFVAGLALISIILLFLGMILAMKPLRYRRHRAV